MGLQAGKIGSSSVGVTKSDKAFTLDSSNNPIEKPASYSGENKGGYVISD